MPLFPRFAPIGLCLIACLAACSGEPESPKRGGDDDSRSGTVIETGSDSAIPPRKDTGASTDRKADDVSKRIPARFQGEWRASRAQCGQAGDDSALTITASQIIFYESEGKVRSVRPAGEDRIIVSADYTGEGDQWSGSSTLRLSGADTLLLEGARRVRCP